MAPELPADTGSLLAQKAGPLPMWGWGVVILGGAYGYKLYKDKKAGSSSTTTTAGYPSTQPAGVQPFYTSLNESNSTYNNSPVTTIGRQLVDTGAVGVQNGVVQVTPPPPPSVPSGPVSIPQAPAPQGQWITVTKWNPNDRNAPSTLSGLAYAAYGNATAWPKIWNAPQNASLVAARKDPTKIQPGDRFWAPA